MVLTMGMIPAAQALASEMAFELQGGLVEFLYIAGVPRWKIKLSWLLFGGCLLALILLLVSIMQGHETN